MDCNLLRDLFILVCTMGFCKWINGLKLFLNNFFCEILSIYCLSINDKNILHVKLLKNSFPKRCISGRNDTLRLGLHLLGTQVYIFSLDLYIDKRPYLSFNEKMRFEWARFASFQYAPQTLGVSAIKLARAGFYYTGRGDGHSCRCIFCGFSYQDWNDGDNPNMIHRLFHPDCPFLVSTFNVVNIPINELERRRSPVFSTRNPVVRTPVTHNGYVSAFQPSRAEDGHTETDLANLFRNLLEELEGFQNQTHVTTLSQQNPCQTQGSNSAANPRNNQPASSISRSNLTESPEQDLTEGQAPIIPNGEQHGPIIPNDKDHEPIIPKDEEQEPIIPDGEQQEPTIPDCEQQEPTIPDGEQQEPTIPDCEQQEPTIPDGEDQEPRIPNNEEQEHQPLNNLILHNNSKNIADIKYPEYIPVWKRRASFKKLPLDHTLSSLSEFAKSGFFYSKTDDCVRCFHCGIGLQNFEIDDNPWVEHARWSKECPYLLQKKGKDFLDFVQVSIAELQQQEANTESQLQTLGEDQEPSLGNEEVKFQGYNLLETRTASFKNWPANRDFLCPTDLAECGFFYTNFGDCVKCFSCGICLHNWETDDMPWIEHARWSRNCTYLLQKKGQYFVNAVQQMFAEHDRQEANTGTENSSKSENSNTDDYPPTTQSPTSIISPTVIESQLQVLREDQETSLGGDEVRFQDYTYIGTRIASFKNWPANRTFLSTFDLAQCGFFYTEMDDSCRCFHCGFGFKGWGPDDSPWYEHARCSKTCPYVIQKTENGFGHIALWFEDL